MLADLLSLKVGIVFRARIGKSFRAFGAVMALIADTAPLGADAGLLVDKRLSASVAWL